MTPRWTMHAPKHLVRPFSDIDRRSIDDVGGKAANLGEMRRAGLPVPDGFVVTVEAYQRHLAWNELSPRIESLLAGMDKGEGANLAEQAKQLQEIVTSAELPDEVRDAIQSAYEELARDSRSGATLVAVRSSAPAEDTAEFSFAGMFESHLGVRGADDVMHRIRDCWASTFSERVLSYRFEQSLPAQMPVAVVVQRMVAADKAGVMFTVDPGSRDANHIVIEAAWGLGEVVVGGQVTPDCYVIDKGTGAVVERTVAQKEFLLALDDQTGQQTRIDLADDSRSNTAVLSDAELGAIAALGVRAEEYYAAPQDLEFAICGESVYLVQARPITTLGQTGDAVSQSQSKSGRVLVQGVGVGSGVASGPVRVLHDASDSAALKKGEVLVARMTAPDWVPAMRRAAAIVTDSGGRTSHAAIVSRELGVPCIVGARNATQSLRDGTVVTVDGRDGMVREGAANEQNAARPDHAPARAPVAPIVTGTRLYVNLAEPEMAEEIARRDVDGVGLLRAELMLLSALENTHPREFIATGRGDEFVARMREKLTIFARAFHPRPVIYRTTDLRSNEFRGLTRGDAFEPVEANPMIGYRGCFRYTREPEVFALELRALAEVREQFDNLHLMIPFVRTKKELAACLQLIDQSPLGNDDRLERWVMAEVPSITYWLPEYAALGITGVSIGSNDLTQLVLGLDRDSELVAAAGDERDGAVLAAIESIITTCRRLGLTCSICGQAPSEHPAYAEQLVRWGITSISVTPDTIDQTRRNIAAAERRIMLEHARTS